MPRARLAQLWCVFLVAAAVVAGWWWVVVWVQSGTIFPLNAVGVIERRDVGADIRLDSYGAALLAVVGAAWVVVTASARREPGLRLLVAAAACLVPPAAYATMNGLSSRNYAGLAVLSAIAMGVAAARIVTWAASRLPAQPGLRVGAFGLAAVVGIAGATAGQFRVGNPGEPALPGQLVTGLRTETPLGDHVVMTFRYSEIVSLELYGHMAVPGLAAVRVDATALLSDFLWIGLRDRQLFGYTRAEWEGTVGQAGTSHLVLAGPHPLTPAELMPTLDRGGLPGLVRAQAFATGGDWATIYGVEAASVRASPADVALHWRRRLRSRGLTKQLARLAVMSPRLPGYSLTSGRSWSDRIGHRWRSGSSGSRVWSHSPISARTQLAWCPRARPAAERDEERLKDPVTGPARPPIPVVGRLRYDPRTAMRGCTGPTYGRPCALGRWLAAAHAGILAMALSSLSSTNRSVK